jgi:hypothetical protein
MQIETVSLPTKLLTDERIPKTAVRLWVVLRDRPRLSSREMSVLLGCSRDTAIASRKTLVQSGWVRVLKAPTKATTAVYEACLEPGGDH